MIKFEDVKFGVRHSHLTVFPVCPICQEEVKRNGLTADGISYHTRCFSKEYDLCEKCGHYDHEDNMVIDFDLAYCKWCWNDVANILYRRFDSEILNQKF